MYRNAYQDFLTILHAKGQSPLDNWTSLVKHGYVRRVAEIDLRGLAIELRSSNVSVCSIRCPKPPETSLGIRHRYLTFLVKNVQKYFTFQVTVLDDSGLRRRIRCSNFQSRTQKSTFELSMPLCLNNGWNVLRLDLFQLTQRAFETSYVESVSVQVNANCWLRRIYFSKELLADHLLPSGFALDPPKRSSQRERKADVSPNPPPSLITDMGDFEVEENPETEEASTTLNLNSLSSLNNDDITE